MKQDGIFRGIYEFEDPSGGLLASKVPLNGTADLYDGTAIIVKPNQMAIFVYNGKITDVLKSGTHKVHTENMPILTQLANWRYGFKSPLRCEIWFFSGNIHTSKRWGTKSPVMSDFEGLGTIPIRAYGTYNVQAQSPKRIYKELVGSKNFLDISDVEEFVQGQLIELLPEALKKVNQISELSKMQDEISIELEKLVIKELKPYGIKVKNIQIQSLLPPEEVLDALESRVAMSLIGDQKKYLMYKAANSLDIMNDGGSNDPMQMMMGLMLGKGIVNLEEPESAAPKKIANKTQSSPKPGAAKFCTSCGSSIEKSHKFCFKCGEKQ